jgi:hypothetical protein
MTENDRVCPLPHIPMIVTNSLEPTADVVVSLDME